MSLSFSFLQVGKLADLVLWNPAFFGAKPEMIIKGGDIAWANMGDANASIPTPELVTTVMSLLSDLWYFVGPKLADHDPKRIHHLYTVLLSLH